MKIQSMAVDVKQPPEFKHNIVKAFGATVENLGDRQGDLKIILMDGKEIGIEVKTVPGDLIASIMDRRLFRQIEGIRERTPWCFLLLSDEVTYVHDMVCGLRDGVWGPLGSWNRNHIEGAFTTVEALGGMIRYAHNGYVDAIQRIVDWTANADNGSITREIIQLSPFDSYQQSAVNMLTLFDGVGVSLAKNFIDWAGQCTLAQLFRLATTPFEGHDRPKNWTNNRIERNRAFLGLKNNEFLRIYTKLDKIGAEWSEELDE